MCRAAFRTCLLVLALAACSGAPTREEVVAQAKQGDEVAFNLVKVDEAVLTVLTERPSPSFHQRFKKYVPPPELKIASGDTVSVTIWESAANGLFGNSLIDFAQSPRPALDLDRRQVSRFDDLPRLPDREAPAPDRAGRVPGGGAASILAAPLDRTGVARPEAGVADGLGAGRLSGLRLASLGEQTGRPGTRIPDQKVGTDGGITVPFAGRIKVAGHTPAEVERQIEALLGPIALDPQAMIAVKGSPANTVTVTGEVIAGARVPLSPGGARLLEVIAAAGGAKAPVHETFVRLSRGGVTATVPLATLVADPDQNIFAEPGDVLTLSRQPQTVSVFGATGKNAAVTFTTEHLSLAEALAKAGGLLDDRADPRGVFLLRYEPAELARALGQPVPAKAPSGLAPIVYRLDLQEAKSYLLAKRFPVQDKDVIFVANAAAVPIGYAFQALSKITGPITTGLLLCQHATNC